MRHYATDQTNTAYDPNGKPTRTSATRVSITTFLDSESEVMNSKTSTTDKSQSASLGGLNQQANGSNVVAALQAMVELAKQIK